MSGCVLLTGGAGFIGSHSYVVLCEAGYDVVILDDFSNSFRSVPARLERITGIPTRLIRADVRDAIALDAAMRRHRFDAVIHLAARKSVPQSLARPREFLEANVAGLLTLVAAMEAHGVRTLVYSSSATVYGQPEALPIPEHAPLSATNPYGLSKLWGEHFLKYTARTNPAWTIGILRYFNPAGAHASGEIGERSRSDGGNLFPLLAQVASGARPYLPIFGADYGTPDGTSIRDFIHVCDLAESHVMSLKKLLSQRQGHTVNLGTGRGYSVLEMVKGYEAACRRRISYRFEDRRPGDVAASFADPSMAEAVLGFRASRGLAEMCRSSWSWEERRMASEQGGLAQNRRTQRKSAARALCQNQPSGLLQPPQLRTTPQSMCTKFDPE